MSFRLHRSHLKGCIAKRKPLINFRSRARRRRWAGRVRHWTVQGNWRHVIFSDEFRVTLFKCDGRMIVWRQGNERYVHSCIQPIRIQNRESLMFWGCIGYGRRGHLVEVNGNLDRFQYTRILQEHLIPSAQVIFQRRNPVFVLQQDNAPPHTARHTLNWLEQQPFQHMEWPPQSPDMNIIETVWARIMRQLRADPPLNIPQLRRRVQQCWDMLSPLYLRRFMTRYLAALLPYADYMVMPQSNDII